MRKRIFSLLLAALLLAALPPAALAEPVVPKEEGRAATGGTWVTVPGVEGGQLCFQADNGYITDCDTSVTAANIPGTIEGAVVRGVDNQAFAHCTALASVTLPNSVTQIGVSAFYNCTSLALISLSSALQTIGTSAFYGCAALESIAIPDTVNSIGGFPFTGCTSLFSISVGEGNTAYASPGGVLYNKAMTTLLRYPSAQTTAIYAIPATVSAIDDGAFEDCQNLAGVTFSTPVRVSDIGDSAFKNCVMLSAVTIPDSVIEIGNSAFAGCTNLASIAIPAAVHDVGSLAFSECSGLTAITVAAANTTYAATDGVLFNKEGSLLIQYSGGKTGAYTVPTTVMSIGDLAFKGCAGLTEVTLPASVEALGYQAFTNCSGLRAANFAGNAPYVADNVFFDGCASDFSIYYGGGTGWTTPTWNGYPAQPRTTPLAAPVLTLARSVANNVGLTWTAVPGAVGYKVYRGNTAASLTAYADTTNPWYSDTGAPANTTYRYQVAAYTNTASDPHLGPFPNTVTANLPAPVLTAPTLTLARNAAGNVGITWARIPGATGYSIYRCVGTGAPAWYASSTNPWLSDAKAAPGVRYTYQVKAYSLGHTPVYSPLSRALSVTVSPYATPALSVAYTQPNRTGLTWPAIPGVQAYIIYRGTAASALTWYASSANPWFIDAASRPGTTYYYKVFGSATIDGTRYYTPHSAVKTAVVPVLSAPTLNIMRMTAGNVGMTWNGINGATGYSIYRGSDPAHMAWYASSTNPWYSDRNTVAGTTYYYQVLTYLQADGRNWYSPRSAPAQVTAS